MSLSAKTFSKALAALIADYLVITSFVYMIEICFKLPFGYVEAIGVYFVISFIHYLKSRLK